MCSKAYQALQERMLLSLHSGSCSYTSDPPVLGEYWVPDFSILLFHPRCSFPGVKYQGYFLTSQNTSTISQTIVEMDIVESYTEMINVGTRVHINMSLALQGLWCQLDLETNSANFCQLC